MIIKTGTVSFTQFFRTRAHTVCASYDAYDIPHVNAVEIRTEISRAVASDFARNLDRRVILFNIYLDIRTVLVVL